MRINKYAFTFLATIALAVSAMLIGCQGAAQSPNSQSASGSTSEASSEKLTLVLDYVPNTNHTGIFVAMEKGFYADEGIELEIVQPPDDGADALVGSGKAQLGISCQDVMANYLGSSNPLPVTAIAAIIQHNTSGIVSRQGEGMSTASGLAGHKYGTWDQDVEKAIMKSIVETDGGNWNDVDLVPANSSDDIAGLRTHMYDAIWIYEGWALQNAKLQDYPVDYFSIRSMNETFDYYTPVIIANDDFLEMQPDIAAKFLAATEAGYQFAIANPDDAADILVACVPEIDPDLAKESQRYLASLYKDDAPYWGYIDSARWNRFYKWMGDQGLIDVPIVENSGFTNEFLPTDDAK